MKDTRNTGKNPQSLAERVHRMTKELHLPGFRQRMEETLEDATWQQMTSLEQIYDWIFLIISAGFSQISVSVL